MENKNQILVQYSLFLSGMANSFQDMVNTLGDNPDVNEAVVKSLHVGLESIRAQTVLIQQKLDDYKGGE